MTATAESAAHHRGLATTLAPLIGEMCGDRLGEISWFKADWQRGGAATGTASYKLDEGYSVPVVLKLPVVQRELMWLTRLQDPENPGAVVPRLYACGDSIGGYDLTWMVMERFPHGPLGLHWHDDHVERVAEAAARFHARAATYAVDQPPRVEDWHSLVEQALESVKINTVGEERRWTTALKTLRGRLDGLVEEWRARDVRQWLHGDLHFANAMSRSAMDAGPVCLIDLAEVHAGHWIEDAVYLERQLWARPERLTNHKPVKAVATARRALGLAVEEDYARLAAVRRALLAGTAPRFMQTEGHPRHLEACLERLERALKDL